MSNAKMIFTTKLLLSFLLMKNIASNALTQNNLLTVPSTEEPLVNVERDDFFNKKFDFLGILRESRFRTKMDHGMNDFMTSKINTTRNIFPNLRNLDNNNGDRRLIIIPTRIIKCVAGAAIGLIFLGLVGCSKYMMYKELLYNKEQEDTLYEKQPISDIPPSEVHRFVIVVLVHPIPTLN
nr:uncharacterized protein LOC111419561 [Onthophagus taurus]